MVSEKKRPRKYRRFLVWLILILFVLLCGSAIFTAQIQGSQDPITVSRTATPAHKKATPSPLVSPDASASASAAVATPLPTPAALFTEDFNDNHNGWTVNTAEYIRTLSNQKLTLSVTNHTTLFENVPVSTSLSDFILSATFTLEKAEKGDKMGLYLRGDSNLDHDYRIDIFGNNVITINKEYLDSNSISQTTQLAYIASKDSVLRPLGQENELQVEMDGPDIILWINGVEVKNLQDTSYTHGQIALFVSNDCASQEATVAFSSVDITSVTDLLPDFTPTATGTPTALATATFTPTPTPTSTPVPTPTPCSAVPSGTTSP